ncbi:hypothetical protein F383_06814 [Gossypium arboreum]|uniref:Uncharacterized protein n=1 Tax=Gossypium arboreum TaxID=29729 RepID=A0A0B0NSY8_GOSAR|nr:hypothetical protein F383_06814 [Gossypium arboreum]
MPPGQVTRLCVRSCAKPIGYTDLYHTAKSHTRV